MLTKAPTKDKIRLFYLLEGIQKKVCSQDVIYGPGSWAHVRDRRYTIESIIKPWIKGFCLDCGCAEGMWTNHMIHNGAKRVLGIDISYPKIQQAMAKKNGSNIAFSVTDWDDISEQLKDFKFDLVMLCQSLEHALDPEKLLNDLFDISKYVFISVPVNERHLDFNMLNNGHLHLYDENKLKNLFPERQKFLKCSRFYGYAMFKGNI